MLNPRLIKKRVSSIKNIGKISHFNWLNDGKYEYKDYVIKDCVEETMGECFEEPENLPLKSEEF